MRGSETEGIAFRNVGVAPLRERGRTPSQEGYRRDIDGLRAIAVLAVIVFHVNKAWIPGGFVGVDIFFVISGYLITRNVAVDVLAGTFSIAEFYRRRVKRIAPAMFVVVATTLS